MSNILILTAYTKTIEWGGYGENDFSHIAVEHNKKYAEINGYDFKYEVLEQKYKDFYPSWVKIPTVLKHLPDYDYVCWIDGDAIFTTKKSLSPLLGKNICLTQAIPARGLDNQFTYISTGFMVFKNSDYSIKVLETLLEQAETYKGGIFKQSHWHEQGLLDELFVENELQGAYSNEKNILLSKEPKLLSVPLLTENFKILPHSYQECYEDVASTFIYHACGNLSTRKERLINKITHVKQIFEDIYNQQTWHGGGSGYGSEINYVAPFLSFFSNWLGKNNINSMVDFGCGDLQWSPYIFNNIPGFKYVGVEVVGDLVKTHSQTWKNHTFIEQDLLQLEWNSIPDVDLYFIKDVLQHWPDNYVISWLNAFFANKPKGKLMIVNCDLANIRKLPQWVDHSEDRTMEIGEFKPLSQFHYPLSEYNTAEVFSWDTKKVYIVQGHGT